MRAMRRAVAKLERQRPAAGCARCGGRSIACVFRQPGEGDYEGEGAPLPRKCPACGREIRKVWVLENRAMWDEMRR